MSKAKERDGFWIIFIFLNVITCENSTRLGCHVNLVLPGDAQHHGFGPPVVLGGQQPAQRLGKNPAVTEREGYGGSGKRRMRTEYVMKARRRNTRGKEVKQKEKESIVHW